MPITQNRLMDLINLAEAQNNRLHDADSAKNYVLDAANKALVDRNIDSLYDCAIALAQLISTAALMPYQELKILAREKEHFMLKSGHNKRSAALMHRRRLMLSDRTEEQVYDESRTLSEETFKALDEQTKALKEERTFNILPPSAEELWTKIKSVWRNHMPFIDGGSIASLSPTTEPELIQELIDTLVNDGRLKPGQFPGEYIPQTETIAPSKQATGVR